jgi:hypothetical protein
MALLDERNGRSFSANTGSDLVMKGSPPEVGPEEGSGLSRAILNCSTPDHVVTLLFNCSD